MAIKRSVIISLGGLKSSSITDYSPLGRASASTPGGFESSLSDNLPISRSVLKQDKLTSEIGPLGMLSLTFTDSNTFQDFFERVVSFVRSFSEAVTSADTLAKSLGRNLQEIANFSDQINNSIGKFAQEVVQTNDFGSVIAQNYTEDNTYFLEDYVGQSATFS